MLRELLANTCDAVLLLDPTSAGILEANAAALSMMRAPDLESLCGRTLASFGLAQPDSPAPAAPLRPMLERAVAQRSHRFEWEARRWDGTELRLEIVLTRLEAGPRLQLAAFCRDITEKRRTLQALKDSDAMHRALFDATRQGVTLHDDLAFFAVNPAAVRILRLEKADDIIGRHPSEISAPVQPDGQPSDVAARAHIDDCLRRGSKRFEWLTRSASGDEFLLDVQLTAIRVGDRTIIQAVLDDISERKAAEAELRRALEAEKSLNQLRANFVSMVSHEFRTPLSVIQSSAEILDNYLDRMESDERRDHLRSIRNNTGRMARLLEEVLFIGRLEAGRTEFRPQPMDLRLFLERLTRETRDATAAHCPIVLELSRDLPVACGDERLLRPLLSNLLINACKYSPEGSPVRLTVEQAGAEARVLVQDSGIGIPSQDRIGLFQPFHRGSNVGQRAGTGLGLTIVRRCVDLHRGRIELASELDRGTTFSVWLPLFPSVAQ